MAALTSTQLAHIQAVIMETVSREFRALPVSKPDLIAAITAIDSWVDSNTVSFNSAIPQPARGALTPKQKAELLLYVVQQRWEVS